MSLCMAISSLLIISYTFVVKPTLISANYVSMEIIFNAPAYYIGYLQLLLYNLINIYFIQYTCHTACDYIIAMYEVNVYLVKSY